MSKDSASSLWDRVGTVVAVFGVLVALAVLVFGGGIVYDHFIDVPRIRYAVLPAYQMEDSSLTGIVLKNTGSATAHEVLMRVAVAGSSIDEYSIQTSELWTAVEGGEGDSLLAVWLDRLPSGSSVTAYLMTSKQGELDTVSVTADEGAGREVSVALLDEDVSNLASELVWLLGQAVIDIAVIVYVVRILWRGTRGAQSGG